MGRLSENPGHYFWQTLQSISEMTRNATDARRRPGRLYRFLAVLAVAISVGAAAGLGALLAYVDSQPPIDELENYEPPASTFVYDSQGRVALAEFTRERRYLLSFRQFPDLLVKAFLAIEDKRYYEHFGIDLIGVARAALTNYRVGDVTQGASTIPMQLPGNILKSIDRNDISYMRKLREADVALQIERRYSKEQILEFYLNQIFLGYNSHGVEAAARTYFGKTVQDLTLAECATLAGLPAAPSAYNPFHDVELCRTRRNQVLRAMLEAEFIDRGQYRQAVREPIETRRAAKYIAPFQAPYFVEYLQDCLTADSEFIPEELRGEISPDHYLYTGGLRVISTLDLALQRIAEEAMNEGLKEVEAKWHAGKAVRRAEEPEEWDIPFEGQERLARIVRIDGQRIEARIEDYLGVTPLPEPAPFHDPVSILAPNELLELRVETVDHAARTFTGRMLPEGKLIGAMAVLEASTGRILALVGGQDFYDASDLKAQFNFAVKGGRQPGSGIKPLFYAAAVNAGFAPHKMFLNVPFDIGEYRGKNYSTRHEGRLMTMHEGLERSQNVMMLRVLQELGVGRAVPFVKKFDYALPKKKGKGNWTIPSGQASVCLGSFDVTPLELAAAYIPFANEGVGIRPRAVDRVESRSGDLVYEPAPRGKVILAPQDAYIVNTMMRGVLGSRGTAYYDVSRHWDDRDDMPEMAAKTGTTTHCNDAWFNAYTPDLVVSVFVGFEPPRTLGKAMTGGAVAGPIFRRFIEAALETRDDWTMKFQRPPGIEECKICLRTGLLAGPDCRYDADWGSLSATMAFRPGTEPRLQCPGNHLWAQED
jgi:penicillin-binding protein 1A